MEWISVKDKLPLIADIYLVLIEDQNYNILFFNGECWEFLSLSDDKITHWMPLPNPPCIVKIQEMNMVIPKIDMTFDKDLLTRTESGMDQA
jgi:hypothetical protein